MNEPPQRQELRGVLLQFVKGQTVCDHEDARIPRNALGKRSIVGVISTVKDVKWWPEQRTGGVVLYGIL
jgi:hypothetical protein